MWVLSSQRLVDSWRPRVRAKRADAVIDRIGVLLGNSELERFCDDIDDVARLGFQPIAIALTPMSVDMVRLAPWRAVRNLDRAAPQPSDFTWNRVATGLEKGRQPESCTALRPVDGEVYEHRVVQRGVFERGHLSDERRADQRRTAELPDCIGLLGVYLWKASARTGPSPTSILRWFTNAEHSTIAS